MTGGHPEQDRPEPDGLHGGREGGRRQFRRVEGGIAEAIFGFVGQVPTTRERPGRWPAARARRIGNRAARTAALSAGTLALPPGPLGWLTLLPELRTVWSQQSQMVADIAGVFGRHGDLSREVMLFCLFRHVAPAAFRGVVQQVGEGVVVHRVTPAVLRAIVTKVAARVALRLLGRGASRWLPIVGAVGVGGLSYYDTGRVAATARELFSRPISHSADEA